MLFRSEVQMSSRNLDLVISEGAIDVVVNLAELPAKTPEPSTSTSAVPLVTEEVYSFRLFTLRFWRILTLFLFAGL